MKVIKNKDSCELTLIDSNDNKFVMHYAAGDLYWTMIDYRENNVFIISKDDNILFLLMEKLFDEIVSNDNPDLNLLNNNCFEWISEAYGLLENANKLSILKRQDEFVIKFYQNPNRPFQRKDICAICFCLSGSKNQNIANAFSLMLYDYIELEKHKSRILK